MSFLLFRIFEQLALALKNRVALQFFTVLKYILLFRIFEQLAVALKTEFALKILSPTPASYTYCYKCLLQQVAQVIFLNFQYRYMA